MMLFGLLFMIVLIGLPILLVIAAVTGVWSIWGRRSDFKNPTPGFDRGVAPATYYTHPCSYCGRDLQDDWKHCPHCGGEAY